jgi:hypothetical protein
MGAARLVPRRRRRARVHSRRCQERLAFVLFLPHDSERRVRRRRDLDAAAPPLRLFDGPGLGQVMTPATDRNVTLVIS